MWIKKITCARFEKTYSKELNVIQFIYLNIYYVIFEESYLHKRLHDSVSSPCHESLQLDNCSPLIVLHSAKTLGRNQTRSSTRNWEQPTVKNVSRETSQNSYGTIGSLELTMVDGYDPRTSNISKLVNTMDYNNCLIYTHYYVLYFRHSHIDRYLDKFNGCTEHVWTGMSDFRDDHKSTEFRMPVSPTSSQETCNKHVIIYCNSQVFAWELQEIIENMFHGFI